MQLVVEAAVRPRDPHQREHDGELPESTPGQVAGQVVSALCDQHDHGQVVEQLQRADDTLGRLLTVGARRLPQVATQLIPPRWASSRSGAPC